MILPHCPPADLDPPPPPQEPSLLDICQTKGLLLLGFANPAPIAHLLQRPEEAALGALVCDSRFFGLRVHGELLQALASHLGTQRLEERKQVPFGDPRHIQFGSEDGWGERENDRKGKVIQKKHQMPPGQPVCLSP